FCSAMPTSTNCFGKRSAKGTNLPEPLESLVTTSRSRLCSAISCRVSEKTSKFAFPIFIPLSISKFELNTQKGFVELLLCLFILGFARHTVMPLQHILHIADTFPFDCVRNNQTRLTACDRKRTERCLQYIYIMPVNLDNFPTKTPKLIPHRIGIAHIPCRCRNLQPIIIDNRT